MYDSFHEEVTPDMIDKIFEHEDVRNDCLKFYSENLDSETSEDMAIIVQTAIEAEIKLAKFYRDPKGLSIYFNSLVWVPTAP